MSYSQYDTEKGGRERERERERKNWFLHTGRCNAYCAAKYDSQLLFHSYGKVVN